MNNKRLQRLQWICRVMTVITMVIIFLFSSQSGQDSYRLSEKFSQWIGAQESGAVQAQMPEIRPLAANDADADETPKVNYFVLGFLNTRKLAHMFLYFVLGLFTYGSFGGKRRCLIAFAVDYLYACTDEIHQHFVGRTGCFSDTLYDAAGILLALVLCELAYRIIWTRVLSQSKKD